MKRSPCPYPTHSCFFPRPRPNYTPLVFDDPDSPGNAIVHEKVREYGNLSFVVVYDAGHFLPFDKPALALEMFRRAVANLDLPSGYGPTNSTAVPFRTRPAAVSSGCGSNTTTVCLISPDQTLGRDMEVQWGDGE